MTKRDFFRVIIKLFGLYSLILSVFTFIPTSFSGLFVTNFEILYILYFLVMLCLVVALYVFLILKTDTILRVLKIDKGFDDDNIMMGNFNSEVIYKLALILLGGYLIINYTPDFLYYCYLALKKEVSQNGFSSVIDNFSYQQSVEYFKWAISGANILIGYLLLTNYLKISGWLSHK